MRTADVAGGLADVLGEDRVVFLPDPTIYTDTAPPLAGCWLVETLVSPEINQAGGREDTYTFNCSLYVAQEGSFVASDLWDKMDEIVDRFDLPVNRTLGGNVSNLSLNATTDVSAFEGSGVAGNWGVVQISVTAFKRVR